MAEWPAVKERFRRLVAKRGVERMAREVPADRATIYRLIRGDTRRPSNAVRAGIERIIEQDQTQDRP